MASVIVCDTSDQSGRLRCCVEEATAALLGALALDRSLEHFDQVPRLARAELLHLVNAVPAHAEAKRRELVARPRRQLTDLVHHPRVAVRAARGDLVSP